MQFNKLWYLQRFNLFQGLSPAHLSTAARMMAIYMLEKHDSLSQMEDPAGRVIS
jgi:hypothetical protein